jgi:hypothetical protein
LWDLLLKKSCGADCFSLNTAVFNPGTVDASLERGASNERAVIGFPGTFVKNEWFAVQARFQREVIWAVS